MSSRFLAIEERLMSYFWSSQQQDYGRRLIRFDGYTRNNLGIGLDDNVFIRKVKTTKAEQIVLSPAEELNVVGLEEHLPELLEGRVVTKGDMIPVNMVGRKIGFLVTTIIPSNGSAITDTNTEFVIGSVPKSGAKGSPELTTKT